MILEQLSRLPGWGYQPSRDLAVTIDAGVDYGSDLNDVERVTCEVARDVMKTVPRGIPAPGSRRKASCDAL